MAPATCIAEDGLIWHHGEVRCLVQWRFVASVKGNECKRGEAGVGEWVREYPLRGKGKRSRREETRTSDNI